MELKDENSALVDLLGRVLDKGIVIQADVVVTLAGVPLLGINLRAALANMDTMISYGMMEDLDEKIRMEMADEEVKKDKKVEVVV
ncbi:MAG: gas vesicle protein [Candidatus Micrarchaeota archaeon]